MPSPSRKAKWSDKSDRSDPSDKSDRSDPSDKSDRSDRLIPRHGGYRRLRSFQVSEQIYDATVIFCDRFIDKRSRTHDQMVQAARSGRQNIAEGSIASATSKKTELKLTNVARASLEELLLDYEDFLRQRKLRLWAKDSPEARAIRAGNRDAGASCELIQECSPEVAANTLVCLVNQAIYLLHRQIQRLEQDFLQQGGFTERLYRKRTEARSRDHNPECPKCGKPMILRTARRDRADGRVFWGCREYPRCTGTRSTEDV